MRCHRTARESTVHCRRNGRGSASPEHRVCRTSSTICWESGAATVTSPAMSPSSMCLRRVSLGLSFPSLICRLGVNQGVNQGGARAQRFPMRNLHEAPSERYGASSLQTQPQGRHHPRLLHGSEAPRVSTAVYTVLSPRTALSRVWQTHEQSPKSFCRIWADHQSSRGIFNRRLEYKNGN